MNYTITRRVVHFNIMVLPIKTDHVEECEINLYLTKDYQCVLGFKVLSRLLYLLSAYSVA
jgi:hypothetical protein